MRGSFREPSRLVPVNGESENLVAQRLCEGGFNLAKIGTYEIPSGLIHTMTKTRRTIFRVIHWNV